MSYSLKFIFFKILFFWEILEFGVFIWIRRNVTKLVWTAVKVS